MEAIFSCIGKPLVSRDRHKMFIVPFKTIDPITRKWSRNRESDETRVVEMLAFYKNGGYIPPVLHLAELKGEGLVCYDGNHRREMFSRYMADREQSSSETETIMCVVDVLFESNTNEVMEVFANLNKSIQVPALYIEDDSVVVTESKDELLKFIKKLETNHRALLSSSGRCHAPQFNRDKTTDELWGDFVKLQELNKVGTMGEFVKLLEALNDEYSRGTIGTPHSQLKPKIVEKCKKHGLWLFMERTIPIEHILSVIAKQQKKKVS